jgi:phosphohistidine phosphatase
MKKLHIIRHAKTEPIQPNQCDYDRVLTERGQLQCSDLASFLTSSWQEVDLILVSAAKRTQMTYEAISPAINGRKTVISPELYLTSATEIIDIIKDLAVDIQSVALVGHNDGLSDLVSYFLDDYQHVPTSGYLHFEFEVEDWSHIIRGSGTLIRHFFSQIR